MYDEHQKQVRRKRKARAHSPASKLQRVYRVWRITRRNKEVDPENEDEDVETAGSKPVKRAHPGNGFVCI
jgi:hypothetical protein